LHTALNINPCRIEELWFTYVAQDASFPDEVPEGIRPEIFKSWKRSKEYGISPFAANGGLPSKDRPETGPAAGLPLIAAARSCLAKLSPLLEGSNVLIALADKDGRVIHLIGSEGETEPGALAVGCRRNEEAVGTCGIGTCIKLGRPVQIRGAEHYSRQYRDYACSAAPIKDEKGTLLGVIDVICPADEATVCAQATACAAADGIEKEILIMGEGRRFTKAVAKAASKAIGFTARYSFDQITGKSAPISEIKQLGMLAARSDSNVLILGESGTGKELLAQSIHNASLRAKAPFIAINCGSLPRSLAESELFGYEAGSFTGANKAGFPGKFELADGGSLFLDEIGDMPLEIQVMLLRVIQTREILRIGGKTPKHTDVRIIAATNVNPAELVAGKQFRKDLYYRLNVLTFHMPALRQRKEDIGALIKQFIENYNRRMRRDVRGFTPAALARIMEYDWPGNVRELENAVERAMNLATGEYLTERELGREIVKNEGFDAHGGLQRNADPRAARQICIHHCRRRPSDKEPAFLKELLASVQGNVTRASSVAGIPKRTLYRKIKRYGIDPAEYRP
jgi:transcriptional regulator with PAS, ATPase and Fis domain